MTASHDVSGLTMLGQAVAQPQTPEEAVLAEAGMTLANVVRINTYVSGREHLAEYMGVRNALFSDPYPASTLFIVSGFARPEFVVEIEIIAAGPA